MISIMTFSIHLTITLAGDVMMSMSIQPIQETGDTRCSHSNAMIRRAIVQTKRISIRLDHMTTGKDNISNIPNQLIIGFCPKDPFVTADQAGLR